MSESSGPRNRARQGSRAPLSREEVVDAAVRYVDEHGLEALTMRALAKEMGVYPTALYWHVGSKPQLVAAASARVLDDIVLPSVHGVNWDVWLGEVARLCRAAMHRHPNLVPIMGSQLAVSTTAVPFVERILGVLEGAGFTGAELVDVYNTVIGFVLGWVTLELSAPPSDAEAGWQKGFAAELRGIDPNTFPVLARNLPLLENNAFLTRWESGRDRPMDRSFDVALDVLVRGLHSKII